MKLKKTEELEMKALRTRQSILSEQHPDTTNALGNLGATYPLRGKLKGGRRTGGKRPNIIQGSGGHPAPG
ncbi:hypothetical protein CPB86DRAFT_584187 [Serendipita vermifera]|nr:hypothetical protein CPB86DRAFT_584187 [Serendipita vermifera]